MVTIVYDDLGPSAYKSFRYDLMADLWGANEKAYVNSDPSNVIGTNMKLLDGASVVDNLDVIAKIILGSSWNAGLERLLRDYLVNHSHFKEGDDNQLRDGLHQVIVGWTIDHDYSGPMWFQFSNTGEIKTALNSIAQTAEGEIDARSDTIGDSEERAVLMSLAYEEPGLIDNVITKLNNNDRAEAWYIIRYDSNDGVGAADKQATALRRYIQSDYFELYNNPANVSYDEAVQVAYTYTDHRHDILSYENQYAPGGNAAAKIAGNNDIYDELQPAIKSVIDHFGLPASHIEELLFVHGSSPDMAGDGTPFDSKFNNDDLIVGDARDNGLSGNGGNDVIMGLDGNDTISGDDGNDGLHGNDGNDHVSGGAGNDMVNGGLGNDTLDGGAGKDTLDGGLGNDKMAGGSGNDTYMLDGPGDTVAEDRNGGTDTAIIAASGNYDIKFVENFKLSGDIAGAVSAKLNDFHSFILSSGDDDLILTINKLSKNSIDIVTGGGADTIKINLAPGVDPSQVLDHKGVTAKFDFTDISSNDTIDLTSIGIKQIAVNNLNITSDHGYYLMAPGAEIHLMSGSTEIKTYNNSTGDWFVVHCGDHTPYGPEFTGNVHQGNFDI